MAMPFSPHKSLIPIVVLGTTIISCILSIAIYVYFFSELRISQDTQKWGAFGDYIGGISGTLIMTSTVIFLLLTLNSQNRAKNDVFFISLIGMNERQMSTMNGVIADKKYVGKEFLRGVVEECGFRFHTYRKDQDKVRDFLKTVRLSFAAYLHHNAEVIDFISSLSKDLTTSQSARYTSIYLAQLTNEEKIIIGYFCAFFPSSQNPQNLSTPESKIRPFYIKAGIKDTIDYEDYLPASGRQKPDAIREILDTLN